MSGAHARLSPSAASRWMACTPSVVLGERFPDTSSSYADEGTLCHDLGDLILRRSLKHITERLFKFKLKYITENKHYSTSLHAHAQDYANYCLEIYAKALSEDKAAVVQIETKIDLSEYVQDGFGRGDFYTISDGTLRFVDLKFGAGVFVSAVNNTQCKLYALGVLSTIGAIYDIKKVIVHIYQPRMDNISEWEISAEDLIEWGELEVKEKAKLAFEGKGELKAGDHCGFCKVKPRCKAYLNLVEDVLQISENGTAHPDILTDVDIVGVIERASLVTNWLKVVNDYAYAKAMQGNILEGLKLVAGRASRHIPKENEDEVKTILLNTFMELTASDLEKTTFKGITELEALVGKKDFAMLVGDLAPKKEAQPKLVLASAPGEPINPPNSAAKDFENIDPDNF